MTKEHRVRVENGKYEFVGRLRWIDIRRHGDPWVEVYDGGSAVRAMMAELDAARVVLQVARDVVRSAGADGIVLVNRLRAALDRHAGLVDDTLNPSEWARPELDAEQPDGGG